jgi:hypothetical protein
VTDQVIDSAIVNHTRDKPSWPLCFDVDDISDEIARVFEVR